MFISDRLKKKKNAQMLFNSVEANFSDTSSESFTVFGIS